MSRRWRRRVRNATLATLAVAGVGWWVARLDASLARTAHYTGYALYGAIVVLASYNVRKKLPDLPLGSSSTWLQLHVYLGAATAVVFYWHTSGRWPDGWIEGTLAALYAATFGSGVWGLHLTRSIPRQLARASEQVVYERIPTLRKGIVDRGRAAVLAGVDGSGATTLADLYLERVDPYLALPRGGSYWLRPTSSRRRAIMRELTDARRFLSAAEVGACEKLFALVRKKDDLDFHEARQGLLKRWIGVHLALTLGLLTLGALHGLLALAMRGGPL